jgi:AbiV family abortive infection protein
VRPVPEFDELVTLIQACLGNAGELLADARILLEAERAPRAHALATLALEEIGKACICILAAIRTPTTEPFYGSRGQGDFWKAWNSHTDKLAWARAFLSLLIATPTVPVAEAVGRLAESTRADHVRKMRGLYVDYAGGAVELPSEVTAAEAEALASDVQAVLDVSTQVWCHDGVRERLRGVLQQHGDALADMMAKASAAISTDPDAAVGVARGLFRQGLSGDLASDEDAAEPEIQENL